MEPRAQLLIYGGFCYFDRAFAIVGVIAFLGAGATLSFDGPYPLLHQTAHKLQKLGRLQSVTLEFLDKMVPDHDRTSPPLVHTPRSPALAPDHLWQGARSSGWVNPDEFGLYGLGAQPAQLGAFVYTDQRRGAGDGVYFRLVPGKNTPKASITVSFPDGKAPLPVDLPIDATVAELMCYVAVKRHVAKHLMVLTRSGKPLELSSTLEACGFEDGIVGYRVAAVYRESGKQQTTLAGPVHTLAERAGWAGIATLVGRSVSGLHLSSSRDLAAQLLPRMASIEPSGLRPSGISRAESALLRPEEMTALKPNREASEQRLAEMQEKLEVSALDLT
jgi:hypothetical protein